jgi:nucleoside 2-deoxyribosyltransferase
MLHEYVAQSILGHVVLLPVDVTDMEEYQDAYRPGVHTETLMEIHKKKIDMADKVIVMNVGGYMGRGTLEEIGYATIKGKAIEYYEKIPMPIKKDESSPCAHVNSLGNLTIAYDSMYEMRSSECHCTICKKEGSWDELADESKKLIEERKSL